MAKRRGGSSAGPRAFIARLGATVAALPTEAEKREAQENLAALIEFLTDMQQRLLALPSAEDMGGIRRAAEALEALFGKAERDPVLAGVLGLRRPPAARPSGPMVTSEDRAKAQVTLQAVRALPGDQIRSELLDQDRHSVNEVRAIAAEVGIRSTERLSRDALAQQISTRIVNDRGYRALRGDDEGTQEEA